MPAAPSSPIRPVLDQLVAAVDEHRVCGSDLLTTLSGVPDPRARRGVRHQMTTILGLALCAVLAGARSFAAIGEWAANASPRVLSALGSGGCPPCESTLRRTLQRLGGDELDAAIGDWTAGRTMQPGVRRALALDGKTLEVDSLRDMLGQEGVTDLVVISHGWNNDMADARALYQSFFVSLRAVLDGAHGPDLGGRAIAVLGVLWPSKKFADADLIASGAADIGGAPGDAEIAAALDDPAVTRKLNQTKALIPSLEGDPAVQKKFANAVRLVLPRGGTGDQDTPKGFFSLKGDWVIERLSKPLPLEAVAPAPAGTGGVVEVGELAPPPDGGGAFLDGFFSGVKAGALKLANYSTYYLMKERAGTVGRDGVCPLLRQLHTDRP